MFSELGKYVQYKVDRLSCINKVQLQPPQNYTPYTISAQARMGVRFPSMWEDLLKHKVYYNSSLNEILDVEFDVNMDVKLGTEGEEEQQRRFTLRNRMVYHKQTGYVRLITKPWLKDPEQKCSTIYIIDDLCTCLK